MTETERDERQDTRTRSLVNTFLNEVRELERRLGEKIDHVSAETAVKFEAIRASNREDFVTRREFDLTSRLHEANLAALRREVEATLRLQEAAAVTATKAWAEALAKVEEEQKWARRTMIEAS